MSLLAIDDMDDATRWQAFASDGVTPSTQIAMANETTRVRFGADRTSGRITATTGAGGHALRRTFGGTGLNLSAVDELRMWISGHRLADGTDARPFHLELKMGSAALSLTAPGNTWQRFFPLAQPDTWELARFSLADLPPAIRGAVNVMQLRCVDATTAFTLYVDDLVGVREEMIADVETALFDRLNRRVVIGATPVPAWVHAPDVKPPAAPYIRIMQYDIRYADDRLSPSDTRCDFSSTGYLLRPPAIPYELHYRVDVFGEPRSTQTRLLEFIILNLGGQGQLLVNAVPVPIQSVRVEPRDELGGVRTDRVALHYRVLVRQDGGTPRPVRAVSNLILENDHA